MNQQREVRFSLGVDGEIAEAVNLPTPGPFEAVVLDERGMISISYLYKNDLCHFLSDLFNLTSDGILANFSKKAFSSAAPMMTTSLQKKEQIVSFSR